MHLRFLLMYLALNLATKLAYGMKCTNCPDQDDNEPVCTPALAKAGVCHRGPSGGSSAPVFPDNVSYEICDYQWYGGGGFIFFICNSGCGTDDGVIVARDGSGNWCPASTVTERVRGDTCQGMGGDVCGLGTKKVLCKYNCQGVSVSDNFNQAGGPPRRVRRRGELGAV